jgi:putative SOS response-associated peptidase YedK
MPAIVAHEDYDAWLDPRQQDAGKLMPLLCPFVGDLEMYPVTKAMSNPRLESPTIVEPVAGGSLF